MRWLLQTITLLGTGAVIGLINRPDLDDSIYAAAVIYSKGPQGSGFDFGVQWIASLPRVVEPLYPPLYESLLATLARWLNLEFLDVYHGIVPIMAGCLLACATFLLLARVENNSQRVLGATLFLLLVELCLGETHRTFGNLILARIHQGKFLFLGVLVPFWIVLSLRFLERGGRKPLSALFILGLLALCLTTTSLIFLPLLSLILALTHRLTDPRLTLGRLLAYGTALLPVLGAALAFRRTALEKIPAGSAINRGFSADFWDQAGYLINPDAPLTPILFGLSGLILTLQARKYRFHLTWIALTVLLLLNPWVSPAVMTHLTTENIYWRLFYLLPFPLIVGIAWLSLFQMGSLGTHAARGLLILAALGALLSPTSVLRPESGNQLRFGYRIPEALLLRCNQLKESLPAGSMLAPEDLAGNLVLLSAKFPQTYVREDYLRFVMTQAGDEEGLADRLAAAHLLYGPMSEANRPEALQRFLRLLQGSARPRYILVHDARLEDSEIKDVLTRAAYHVRMKIEGQWVVLAEEDPR